jgi:hypothetical protein
MIKENANKPTKPDSEAIAKAYRDAVARGDVEEIERLDALVAPAADGKASEQRN